MSTQEDKLHRAVSRLRDVLMEAVDCRAGFRPVVHKGLVGQVRLALQGYADAGGKVEGLPPDVKRWLDFFLRHVQH